MIKISNSYDKRLFLNLRKNITQERKKDVEKLKQEIEKELYKIEEKHIEERDYNLLSRFEGKENIEMLSLFYYKQKIKDSLTHLKKEFRENTYKEKDDVVSKKYLDEKDYAEFLEALGLLENDIYKLLVADFQTIKNYILSHSESVLIYRGKPKETTVLYKKYKETFENLYNDYLSNTRKTKFKKSFFELFDNMNVCPYCNRNYINPIYKNEKKLKDEDENRKDNYEQSPDIEHFFPKSMYPFLSLSISNLLPSCGFCNKIKSNVDTMKDFKSPYEIENEDFKFEFSLKELNNNFIKIEGSPQVKRNIEVLDLENMYNTVHSQFIDEVFYDIRKYPKSNQEFLESFDISSDEILDKKYKQKFRNYFSEEDFNKQPLSKMTKDLFLQIKEDED